MSNRRTKNNKLYDIYIENRGPNFLKNIEKYEIKQQIYLIKFALKYERNSRYLLKRLKKLINKLGNDYEELVIKYKYYKKYKKNLENYNRNVFICSMLLYNNGLLLSDLLKLTNEDYFGDHILYKNIIYNCKVQLHKVNEGILFPINYKTASNIIKSCFKCGVNDIKLVLIS